MSRLLRAAALAALVGLPPAAAVDLPRPAYDNSLHFYVESPGNRVWTDAAFKATADTILQKLTPGPYVRVGVTTGFALDLPWNANLGGAVLQQPSLATLSALMVRAQARGLAVHLGVLAGISRAPTIYDAAKTEDRRNAQWYRDGTLLAAGQSFSNDVWMTPSRYARKLRRHLEAKTRLLGPLLVALRQAYPDTFTSASGDGELELNSSRGDPSAPYEDQMIADYSPFAILEFRDWIQHAGLYGPGQPFGADGWPQGGTAYQGASGLVAFNQAFGTAFATWSLKYFDWSLADPVDGDPRVIPSTAYDAPGWTPTPTSGPGFLANGFDAPRAPNAPTPAFWQLWLDFRQALVGHYTKDFSTWVTTSPGPGGATFEVSRWYTHQIPADYIGGRCPSCPNPETRLITSASPMTTAAAGGAGSLGVTCFDTLEPDGYHRTSLYLFEDVAALHVNWGIFEYSPSWIVGAAPDTDVPALVAQVQRAYDAGAHILSYSPWEHFIGTKNPVAFAHFIDRVRNQPRDGGTVSYVPPQVQGLAGSMIGSLVSLRWSPLIFPGVPQPTWTDWPGFARFEVWRGATPDFTVLDGQFLGSAVTAALAGTQPTRLRPYYKVLAVSRDGERGALSAPVSVGPSD